MSLLALLDKYPPRTVQTGSRKLSYRESGKGARTLVLLHGVGTDSASWIQQLDAFSPDCRVIAWDAPGYGESTPPASGEPVATDYADALLALLDAMDIKQALLVGQSIGAIMASAFAARHPERIEKLVLTGPAAGYGDADAAERAERLNARVKQMNELGPAGMAASRGAAMLSEVAGGEIRDFMGACQKRLIPAGYIQAVHMLSSAIIARDAARYAAPVLVLSGTIDKVTRQASCQAIAQAFPCGSYRALPGLGHGSYVEGAAQVNAILGTYFGLAGK
jgi:pimeloyl-ACP methyl ester carboxylesterase